MQSVGGMDKQSNRAGTAHCLGNLLRDNARFTYAHHDRFAVAIKKKFDGFTDTSSIDNGRCSFNGGGFEFEKPDNF